MKSKYIREDVEQLIKEVKSWRQVCIKLGIKPATGSQVYLKKKAIAWGLDFSHFTGQAWNKGNKKTNKKKALDYCFLDSNIISHKLKLLLIRDNIKKEECEVCGLKEWLGEKTVLELHHIDRNHNNNELCNLQIVCPNCHALITRKKRQKPK